MANDDYIFLHDINGNPIKPVTDLAAINMTTTNGIHVEQLNGGTIGIQTGYIESAYYTEMVDPAVGPARPGESYVEGGTMYTLLGGYTISQEVPGPNPSPYKVPSEVAVRAAIDAYVATGGTDIVPGKAINVTGGSINVTTAEVEDLLDEATPVDTKAVTPEALLGALSVGQAVDVSCAPYTNTGTITYGAGGFLDGFTVTMVSGTTVGFYDTGSHSFPKFAKDGNNNPLHYIFIADVSGTGTITPNGYDAITLSNTPQRISTEVTAEDTGWFSAAAAATVNVANWRQYEVTALTEAAKDYIANAETNPDPDALFRSTNTYSILNKYLIKQDMVSPFVPIINMDNKNVTIGAGLAYSVKLTDGQNHDFTVDTIPSNGYGWDSHLQLFIAGTSEATFVPPLALMDPLTPNAGHNITIKWRAGQALAYVDDTDIGYVVSIQSGTENGTLYYGLKNETGEYVVFAGALDGQVIEIAGNDAFVSRNTRVIGNGTDATIIAGTFGAGTDKTLSLQSVSVNDSTIGGNGYVAFSDVVIPEGITVSRLYGKLMVESLEVNGTLLIDNSVVVNGVLSFASNGKLYGTGTIDLNNNSSLYPATTTGTAEISGLTIKNGNNPNSSGSGGGALRLIGKYHIKDCYITASTCARTGAGIAISAAKDDDLIIIEGTTITDCFSSYRGGALTVSCDTNIIDCLIYGNTASSGACFYQAGSSNLTITGSTLGDPAYFNSTTGSLEIIDTDLLSTFTLTTKAPVKVSNIRMHASDVICYVDTCYISGLHVASHSISSSGDDIVVIADVDPWKISNIKLTGNGLNAAAANTVVLSGMQFNTTARVKNANRIQLPADSTNRFTGNTLQATDKILEAGIIVVGDDPSIPGGTATINYVTGTTVLSGIGTYVQKNGVNDFVANNATNVVAVNASTTGAKYLGTVLSATTGDTGANRFAKIDSGAVAVVNEATNAVNKQIITHDYEPIIGGTFSLTSATVNEATKTVAIQSGGTMSVVDIRGGKNSVIDLGLVDFLPGSNAQVNMYGVTISRGGTYLNQTSACVFSSCTFQKGSTPSTPNQCPLTLQGNKDDIRVNNCIFQSNFTGTGSACVFVYKGNINHPLYLSNCVFSSNTLSLDIDINLGGAVVCDGCEIQKPVRFLGGTSSYIKFTGSNHFLGETRSSTNPVSASVIIDSGAIVDLTGNTYTTVFNPVGGITIPAGAIVTIIGSAGTVSSAYLSELAITGSTITNAPAVLGATITIPTSGGPYEVRFADGTSSTYAAGESERQEELTGAIVYVGSL